MRANYPSLFAVALLYTAALLAADPLPLKIGQAWIRAVPPSITDSAAFMRLENTGAEPLRLTGATTPIAAMAMPMITTHKVVQGVEILGMQAVDSIDIPPHGGLSLKPGGDHLMLMSLKTHPRPGEKIELTLDFEPGRRTVTIEIPVQLDAP